MKLSLFKELGKAFLDLVFPASIYCICCGEPVWEEELYSICKTCKDKIFWISDKSCAKCGKILQDWYEPELCMDCLYISHKFSKGFCCVQYEEAERQIIHQLKYSGKGYLGKKIAKIMFDRIVFEKLNVAYIIPVPVHKLKLRERGYNQAGLIAKSLAGHLKLPYKEKILIRVRETEPMNQLRPKERRRNMKGAFAVAKRGEEEVRGRRILLVDDIFTTGSTVDACTEALLSAGAEEVLVFTFAAGANEK